MISKLIIYKNGHFYDKSSKQRLSLRNGAELLIAGDDFLFEETEPAGIKPKELSSQLDLANELKKLFSQKMVLKYEKLFNSGKKLYFYISISTDIEKFKYEFEVELLEDLYVHIKPDWQKQEGRLYDCACKVINCVSKNIDFFEPVYGRSLNELYKNTYVHFFGNEGNPACNAMDRFFETNNNEDTKIRNKIKI